MSDSLKVKQVKSALAFLASSIGLLALAIVHMIAEITGGPPGPVGKALTFHSGIGPYSGKQALAVLAWLLSWFILNKMFADKDIDENKIMRWTYILYFLATLIVFPPFLSLL